MLHAIIMAGGSGTRFWPASRANKPKQLLSLAGAETMIEATALRLRKFVSPRQTLVITNKKLVDPINQCLPADFPKVNVIGEPCKRDTAPCIGLAAALVMDSDPDATMMVMPSDHVISPDDEFVYALGRGAAMVEAAPKCIVTFGIKPTYPAESFGYIERGASFETPALGPPPSIGDAFDSSLTPLRVSRVKSFKEKPKAEVAIQYLTYGNFFWNSGIFIWKAKTIWDALAKNEPKMFAHLDRIRAAIGKPDYNSVLEREFEAIQGKSIDFAVMEKHPNVVMIEAPFTWDDVGTWQSLQRLLPTDEDGNTVVGKHIGIRTSGTIVHNPPQPNATDHLVVTMGLKDCLIVHTPDATLVANKHDEEAVREVVKILQERGWSEYL
jgi:mannose-1-phosphate guanylyltransferase